MSLLATILIAYGGLVVLLAGFFVLAGRFVPDDPLERMFGMPCADDPETAFDWQAWQAELCEIRELPATVDGPPYRGVA